MGPTKRILAIEIIRDQKIEGFAYLKRNTLRIFFDRFGMNNVKPIGTLFATQLYEKWHHKQRRKRSLCPK